MKSALALATLATVATVTAEDKTGFDACEDTSVPCTLISVSEDRHMYGDVDPRKVADGLWEHCEATGCIGDYYQDAHTKPGVMATDELKVTTDGEFTDENRHALIFAMTEIMGVSTTSDQLVDETNMRQGRMTLDVHYAPSRLHVSRYQWSEADGRWDRESELSITVGLEGAPKETCQTIMGVLAAASGSISGAVGSALGMIAPACNALPSHN